MARNGASLRPLRRLASIALAFASPAPAQTLAAVKARGALVCGVNEGLPGFSYVDERGQWSGFDVDFCRAVAAAVFNDPNRLRLVPLSAEPRFEALKDGKIDVLSRNSTWTIGREVAYGLTFVGVTYYDGQGFMAPRAMRVSSALELDGARVACSAARRRSTTSPTSSPPTTWRCNRFRSGRPTS